jgi:hypothetical protein
VNDLEPEAVQNRDEEPWAHRIDCLLKINELSLRQFHGLITLGGLPLGNGLLGFVMDVAPGILWTQSEAIQRFSERTVLSLYRIFDGLDRQGFAVKHFQTVVDWEGGASFIDRDDVVTIGSEQHTWTLERALEELRRLGASPSLFNYLTFSPEVFAEVLVLELRRIERFNAKEKLDDEEISSLHASKKLSQDMIVHLRRLSIDKGNRFYRRACRVLQEKGSFPVEGTLIHVPLGGGRTTALSYPPEE